MQVNTLPIQSSVLMLLAHSNVRSVSNVTDSRPHHISIKGAETHLMEMKKMKKETLANMHPGFGGQVIRAKKQTAEGWSICPSTALTSIFYSHRSASLILSYRTFGSITFHKRDQAETLVTMSSLLPWTEKEVTEVSRFFILKKLQMLSACWYGKDSGVLSELMCLYSWHELLLVSTGGHFTVLYNSNCHSATIWRVCISFLFFYSK